MMSAGCGCYAGNFEASLNTNLTRPHHNPGQATQAILNGYPGRLSWKKHLVVTWLTRQRLRSAKLQLGL